MGNTLWKAHEVGAKSVKFFLRITPFLWIQALV